MTSLAGRVTEQLRPVTEAGGELAAMFGVLWRRSLKVRVVSSTVALSSTVVLVLGMVLQAQLAQRLIENKTQAALLQAENSRVLVESELGSVDPTSVSLAGRLTTAVDRLTNPDPTGAGPATASAGTYEPVLVEAGTRPGWPAPAEDRPAGRRPGGTTLCGGTRRVRSQDHHSATGSAAVTMLAVGMPVAARAGRCSFTCCFRSPLSSGR